MLLVMPLENFFKSLEKNHRLRLIIIFIILLINSYINININIVPDKKRQKNKKNVGQTLNSLKESRRQAWPNLDDHFPLCGAHLGSDGLKWAETTLESSSSMMGGKLTQRGTLYWLMEAPLEMA